MRLETKKYLLDIQQSTLLAAEFVAGRTFTDYQETALLRAAVERQCEIIGEALIWLSSVKSAQLSRLIIIMSSFQCPLVPGSSFLQVCLAGGTAF